jgi:hypothetical protein
MSHKTIAIIAVIMVGVFFSIVVVYPLIFNPSQIGSTAQKPLEIPTPPAHMVPMPK